MNRTYIKRQLTLNKLGFPINEDIQAYIDLFNELVGDPRDLNKEYGEYLSAKGYMYSNNNKRLLFFHIMDNDFYIQYELWSKFEHKFKLNYQKIKKLLTVLLEDTFNCELNDVSHLGTSSFYVNTNIEKL